ncbi:MAG: type IV pilin [Candidatus Dadabacteria bacterium]|nr:type IV pilin [Candidatus Dadabacteria bacterium]
MKANKKYIEGEDAVSAVIGVILMVAITVAIAATVYVYVSGLATSPSSEAENASVAVKAENGKIKITLTTAGNNMPDAGYSFANTVGIRVNGRAQDLSGFTGLSTDWPVGLSLYVYNNSVAPYFAIDDVATSGSVLEAGSYSLTVVIADTVIYDDSIRII